MTARLSEKLVNFVPVDPDGNGYARVAVKPEGQFSWQPGIKPSVWSVLISHLEMEKLKAAALTFNSDIGLIGRLELIDTPSAGAEAPKADVTIKDVRIVDCEPQPLELREVPGDSKPLFVTYRLCLADFRDHYVSPRGGRLKLGHINPSEREAGKKATRPKDDLNEKLQLTFKEMVLACLRAMGLDDSKMKLPDTIDKIDPPKDVRWFGNHAPTELEKLLKRANYVFVPHLDATVTIEAIGNGATPTLRKGDALPELLVPSVDRRGKTVIITSYPTRPLETRLVIGPNVEGKLKPPYFDFVVQDVQITMVEDNKPVLNEPWVVAEKATITSLPSEMRTLFVNTAEQFRAG